MQFLYPGFLIALFALAIPIIIHLFHFRRFKTVYFTNVRFLKEIKQETSSRNRLKNLLVLLMRCLALAALVLTFAQPYIPKSAQLKTGTKQVSIFIDNSFSMQSKQQDVSLLDIAKNKAQQLVNAYDEDTRIQIITNDLAGKHQRLVYKDDALSAIEEIDYSPAHQMLSNIVNRQSQLLDAENKIVYLLSDFQKSAFDLNKVKDTSLQINLLPLQAIKQNNLSIDSAWFENPVQVIGQNNKLLVKITNYGNNLAEKVNVSFLKDGEEKPFGLLDIPAKTSVIDTINIAPNYAGTHKAELRLTDYPIQFDDRYYICFEVPEALKVLTINNDVPNKFLQALFGSIGYFTLDNVEVSQINYQSFAGYDLIILNNLQSISTGLSEEIKIYIKNGGKVLVFPSSTADLASYNQFFSAVASSSLEPFEKRNKTVGHLNTEEFVFSDIFEKRQANIKLPSTSGDYLIKTNLSVGAETLMKYTDGSSFLTKVAVDDGLFFICAAPLEREWNDLMTNAEIFVPMMFRIAISGSRSPALQYTIGKQNIIELFNVGTSGDAIFKIKGKSEFIPGQSNFGRRTLLDVKNQISESGFYQITLDEDTIKEVAFNYDRRESEMEFANTSDLLKITPGANMTLITPAEQSNLGNFVAENLRGKVLWKWFLIASLLFLLLESLIIRLFKS